MSDERACEDLAVDVALPEHLDRVPARVVIDASEANELVLARDGRRHDVLDEVLSAIEPLDPGEIADRFRPSRAHIAGCWERNEQWTSGPQTASTGGCPFRSNLDPDRRR